MPRSSKYDNMTKEEIIAEMRKRNKGYSWSRTASLTLKEGEIMDNVILPKFDCKNISQLLKKIVKGELEVLEKDRQEV